MNKFVIIAASGLVWLTAVSGEDVDPKKAEPSGRLGARIGTMRDGGSGMITIPAHGGRPACEICVDRASDSKTPGEIFFAKDFVEERKGKQLPWEEADKLLKQLEQVLITRFGAPKLLEIVLNPIEPGTHLSEEEFGNRMVNDPDFADRLNARYLMDEIIAYRTRHGPLVKRK